MIRIYVSYFLLMWGLFFSFQSRFCVGGANERSSDGGLHLGMQSKL